MSREKYYGALGIIFLLMACGGPKTADELWQHADENIKSRQFTQALKSLNKLIDKYPDNPLVPKAQFQIGDVYLNGTGQLDEAVQAFQVTADMYQDLDYGVKSLFMIGFIQANYLQAHEEARHAYNTFLERYPNHELVASVQFELENLGKEVGEIETLKAVVDGE